MNARAIIAALAIAAPPAAAQGPRLIQRDDYADRLRGMWLGQCIANWTGLRSEGKVTQPPFLTDDDWGIDLGKGPLEFVLDQDPWLADDDTDVEYVALHLLDALDTTSLTGPQLAAGWLAHMDDNYLWVSNQQALDLMRRGLVPPETGLPGANQYWLHIDAQLTTEFFGAIAPGMPRAALEIADIPITNTARGHALHAAQHFVLLYCLASQADPALSPRDRIVSLVIEAREHTPDSSKAADIIDLVLADYLANPDPDDWERTRDLVYDRYQRDDAANGFRYRSWVESSVNFASGLIALLYGEGDFLRTAQIGTLTGWDSDNGTATMGGLVGLMLGHEQLVAQIRASRPGYQPSDRYDIERTRNNLPDRLPEDPLAQDTLTAMAERTARVAERLILERGGIVDAERGLWLLPPRDPPGTLLSPGHRLYQRSAARAVRHAGGTVTAWSSVAADPPQGFGSRLTRRFADGFEIDDSGIDVLDNAPRGYYSSLGAGQQPGDTLELGVTYDRPVAAASILMLEGEHFHQGPYVGGWFLAVTPQLLVNGQWIDPPGGFSALPNPDPSVPFQLLRWDLAQPVAATGVRLLGPVGGSAAFVTCAEIDLLAPDNPGSAPSFDLDANGRIDADDIYRWHRAPVDLDGDRAVGLKDLRYLHAAARWGEIEDMSGVARDP